MLNQSWGVTLSCSIQVQLSIFAQAVLKYPVSHAANYNNYVGTLCTHGFNLLPSIGVTMQSQFFISMHGFVVPVM